MTRPNRMTPFGVPEAVPARGTLMGNRGCLVDRQGRLARPWQLERWITCVLEFRGRRRTPLMAPGRYTELFFLDEATALAAGHRPCAECRRADAHAFRRAWDAGRDAAVGAFPALDHALHAQRTAGPWRARGAALPDGTMVAVDGDALLVHGDALLPWSHGGYGPPRPRPAGTVDVVTPRGTVAALAAGWTPQTARLMVARATI